MKRIFVLSSESIRSMHVISCKFLALVLDWFIPPLVIGSAEEAFLLWAFRMTDVTRLTASASLLHMNYTLVDRIFNRMSCDISGTDYLWLYDNLRYFDPRLQMYNDAIIEKMRSQNPGAAIPPFAFKICGFEDRTRYVGEIGLVDHWILLFIVQIYLWFLTLSSSLFF